MAVREEVVRAVAQDVRDAINRGAGCTATGGEVLKAVALVFGQLMSSLPPEAVAAWMRREAARIEALARTVAVNQGELETRQ